MESALVKYSRFKIQTERRQENSGQNVRYIRAVASVHLRKKSTPSNDRTPPPSHHHRPEQITQEHNVSWPFSSESAASLHSAVPRYSCVFSDGASLDHSHGNAKTASTHSRRPQTPSDPCRWLSGVVAGKVFVTRHPGSKIPRGVVGPLHPPEVWWLERPTSCPPRRRRVAAPSERTPKNQGGCGVVVYVCVGVYLCSFRATFVP